MPKFITEIRQVLGMVRDLLHINIPKNKYYSAQNINLTPNQDDSIGGATAMLGSELAFNLGEIDIASNDDDYKAWRIPADISVAGLTHSFTITGLAPFNIVTSGGTPTAILGNFIAALNAATSSIGGEVYLFPLPASGIVYLGFRAYSSDRDLTESISTVPQEVIIIKEFFGVACNGAFEPLKSVTIGNNLFIISTNSQVFRLGVAQKNYLTDAWTYTILLETNQLKYATDAVIDFDGEIDFAERVSLYFTGTGYLPRCLYVKNQDTWVANSAMIYYNSIVANEDGYYIYDTLLQETSIQILENYARITNFTVNNTGGNLTAGDKQYFVRMYISGENASGIGVGSTIIPIFTDSLSDVTLSGDIGGQTTNKSISLTISGLNPKLYSSFELIRVNNIQGVFTADIVQRYDINANEQIVLDNGSSIAQISISELATQQIVIKDAKNLVIARNRLFLSNITTQIDYDLSTWAKTITVETGIEFITAVGKTTNSVNEYMTPYNYKKIGYQEFETYRLGIQLYFKNGFVSSPYFVNDWKVMRDDTYQNALTTDNDVDPTPNSVLVFHPIFNIDFTTASIDGVPLNELVYGYSIVRQDCVQEIWSGILMPSQTAIDGTNYACGQNTVLANGPYTQTGEYRKDLMFLCPDLNFDNTNIAPASRDKIINYGSVLAYNYTYDNSQVGSGGSFYSLSEFSGKTNNASLDIQELNVEKAEIVDFNSISSTEFLAGVKATTQVDFGVTTQANDRYGCNQKVIAVRTEEELDDLYVSSPYAQPSWSANYALWYKPRTNKYGNENSGTYRGCEHFRVLDGATTVVDTTVYGGDTFPQKTFSKFCNLAYLDNTYQIRTDVSATLAVVPFPNFVYHYYLITDYDSDNVGFMPQRVLADYEHGITSGDEVYGIDILFRGFYLTYTPTTGTPPTKLIRYDPVLNQYKLIVKFGAGDIPNFYTDTNNSPITIAAPTLTTINYGSKTRWAVSFYTSNRGNYQLRYFNDADSDKNYPYQTSLIREWLSNQLSAGAMLYSGSYSPNMPATTYRIAFDNTQLLDTKENNVIIYSELKLTNSLTDSYRIFKPLNRKEYPAKYGSINNTFVKDMNYLVVFMNEIVLYQALDQQQNQTQPDGSTIIIGDGTVLGAREQTISNIGLPYKTMAISYINSRGINHMSWYNPIIKKWMRYTGSLNDIGEECGVQSFLTANTNNSFSERSIVFGYDFINDELLLTAIDDKAVPQWGSGSTYVPNDEVSYQPQDIDQPQYYIAKKIVPLNKNPYLPENQVQLWEINRQSNFTLSYNDKLNVVSDFKDFLPKSYFVFNNLVLSKATVAGINNMYEHNKGLKLYDNTDITSSITVVFNDLSDFYKVYRTIYSDISIKPTYVKVSSPPFVSYTNSSDIKFIRPHFGSDVYNDATISVNNPDGLNNLNTAQPSGQTVEVTLYFSNTSMEDMATLRKIIMKMIPKPKFFNN